MLTQKDIVNIEFMKKAQCTDTDTWICGCSKKLQNRLLQNIDRWIRYKSNGDIVFEWACGKGDTIISMSIPIIQKLSKTLELEPMDIIKNNIEVIKQRIQDFFGPSADPYLVATDNRWNKINNTLEIKLQRWVKKKDNQDFLKK